MVTGNDTCDLPLENLRVFTLFPGAMVSTLDRVLFLYKGFVNGVRFLGKPESDGERGRADDSHYGGAF